MDVGDPIANIGIGPPQRGIRATHEHRHETAHARARPAGHAVVDRICIADLECRQRLKAAVMEISRLQRGILTAGERAFLERPPRRVEDVPPDPKASPPTERKAYAPDPVGKPPEPTDTTPPDPSERVRVIDWLQITNLGTLLDVLV